MSCCAYAGLKHIAPPDVQPEINGCTCRCHDLYRDEYDCPEEAPDGESVLG